MIHLKEFTNIYHYQETTNRSIASANVLKIGIETTSQIGIGSPNVTSETLSSVKNLFMMFY